MNAPASSAASARNRAVAYWATTAIIAAELAVGGAWDSLRTDYVREIVERFEGVPDAWLVFDPRPSWTSSRSSPVGGEQRPDSRR
jgi:hypothetical protein